MRHRVLVAACALFWGAAVLVPFPLAAQEQRQMMADIRMLQEQAQQLQILLSALAESLKAVNARLDQQNEATRKAFADQRLNLDALSNDLRVVREKVDDSNIRIGSLSQEVDALRQSVVRLNVAPAPAPGEPLSADGAPPAPDAAAPSAPSPPPAAADASTAPMAPGASPQRLWDMAFAEYGAGQFDLAIMGFEAYVKSFPRSDSADDAQVYICSAYLNDGKYDQAVASCDVAIRTYPDGSALPEAYYRKGVALQSLQRPDEARASFEHVLKTYPNTVAATLAQQRLEGLKPQ
jgi:tol-pal system protein YbgF